MFIVQGMRCRKQLRPLFPRIDVDDDYWFMGLAGGRLLAAVEKENTHTWFGCT